ELILAWRGDAVAGGVAVEVVEGGELSGGGLDGVAGLGEQAADVADVAADGGGGGLEQGGDGVLGQAVAVVQDGGGELAGQGVPGAGAVAVCLAGAVAAAAVQGGFAERGGGGGQGGGQGVEGGAGQAGDGGAGEPGQVRGGPGGGPRCRGRAGRGRGGVQGVVPVAVPVVPGQRQGVQLGLADRDAGRVGAGVQLGVHGQAGAGGGGRDRVHDHFVAGQRAAAPVHGDRGEQPVLDLVPPGGAGREVAAGDLQPGQGGRSASPAFQARVR